MIFGESVDDLAVNETECSCGIALIGVDVHSGSEGGLDTDNNVVEDGLAAVGVDLNLDDLLVLNAELGSGLGSQVDVALCDDHTVVDGDLTCGAAEGDAGGACNVAALTDGSSDAECASIGEGELDLGLGSGGAEDGHLESALGTNYFNLLFASELAGLAQILLVGQLVTLAEQSGKRFLGDVKVTGRGFNQNFLHDDNPFSNM